MKLICWIFVAVAGLAVMVWTYFTCLRPDAAAPWSSGILFLGNDLHDAPRKLLESKHVPTGRHDIVIELHPETRVEDFKHLSAPARQLPAGLIGAAMSDVGRSKEALARSLAARLSDKFLLLDPNSAGIGQQWLLSGRLPRAGDEEVLAGFQARARDRLQVAGHDFNVVGVLRRDVGLLADCYLLPPHDRVAKLFTAGNAVHSAWLVQPTIAQWRDSAVRGNLELLFPHQQFVALAPMVRVERSPYYVYLAGEAVLLLGGSLALMTLYRVMARHVGSGPLGEPLAELAARPKLLGALHLVYFGLMLTAALVVYDLPDVQLVLLSAIRGAFTQPQNPLAVAAKAYGSQNIAWAAIVTFAINFLLGSTAVITVPSLLVPGSGILMACLRATAWGLLLAPAFVVLSLGMLPHAGTMLLEGEGYILATFFGLLVPAYLFDRRKGVDLPGRYGRALLLNLKALTLVALVLLAAACYEATEVILMMRYGR